MTRPMRGLEERAVAVENLATRLWGRLPVVVRAVVIGNLVTSIGGLGALFIFANLKLFPRIPWLLPATAAWLWVFWRYVNGAGWPRATREARRRDLRASPLPARVWGWSLLAGSVGMVSVLGLAFLTPRLAEIPRDAFKLPLDFSAYPWWMVVSILLAISVVSGVTEEAGYRGYMLSPIQRRHGWIAATAITGLLFFLDHHFSHAYATWAFLPFFLAVSALHARLVYLTRSILPSIVLHSVFDFLVIPVQYGLIGTVPVSSVLKTGVDSWFLVDVALILTFGVLAVPAFRKLASVAGAAGVGEKIASRQPMDP
jgi:membrane protease YdiL (CAAX protease family)